MVNRGQRTHHPVIQFSNTGTKRGTKCTGEAASVGLMRKSTDSVAAQHSAAQRSTLLISSVGPDLPRGWECYDVEQSKYSNGPSNKRDSRIKHKATDLWLLQQPTLSPHLWKRVLMACPGHVTVLTTWDPERNKNYKWNLLKLLLVPPWARKNVSKEITCIN